MNEAMNISVGELRTPHQLTCDWIPLGILIGGGLCGAPVEPEPSLCTKKYTLIFYSPPLLIELRFGIS